jgi:hypothetical protein
MSTEFEPIFVRLREMLQKYSGALSVTEDSPNRYCLEGSAGPAAIRAWDGKARRPMICVAWVQIGKAYVSYHLMEMYGNTRLLDGMSKKLKTRMQGKTCFNFKSHDEALFKELEQLTVQTFTAFKKAGFIAEQKSA